jgi:hypothetical protein
MRGDVSAITKRRFSSDPSCQAHVLLEVVIGGMLAFIDLHAARPVEARGQDSGKEGKL